MRGDNFHKQNTKPSRAEEIAPPSLPEKIGPYKVEAVLGKGSMSLLYMGIDPVAKIPVVIKVLPKNLLKNKETLDRFLKESKLTSLVSHPNIVKLYKEDAWEGGLYIAMEWIRGVSLRQFLTQQSFSLKRSLEIILQICQALKHLHQNHIIHRDLKPENILITEEGVIKVIDFGIAQMTKEAPLRSSSSILGTPNYMSPEQKKNPSEVTYSSDIYSLGVLAYELILGKLSYGVIHTSLLPRGLKKIITKALAISLDQRYQTIDPLIEDLTTYLHSDELDKEKPREDESTELLEVFQKNSTALSPIFFSSSWAYADIGIGKLKSFSKLGLYYDLFLLPKESLLIFTAEPLESGLEAVFSAACLRGTVKTLILEAIHPTNPLFEPSSFLEALQRRMESDPFIANFALSYLILSPIEGIFRFYNSGLSQIIYTPAGEQSRMLCNCHPPLFQGSKDFSETTESWKVGDVIIYHDLLLEEKDSAEKKEAIETQLKNTLKEQMFLSAQAQADVLIKEICQPQFFQKNEQTKVLFSIQRIS